MAQARLENFPADSVPAVVPGGVGDNRSTMLGQESRLLTLWILASAAACSQTPRVQLSHTSESLRGVSTVSRTIAWASGTHGTYLRTTDGGLVWTPAQVPDAVSLDFRAVVAFSAEEAFLMSAGPGDQSRIYHTTDGGQRWQLEFTNPDPKGFFDSMAFWDPHHGIVLGDPILDASGKLHFEVLLTDDGQTWHPIPSSALPEALPGEGAFAASNRSIAILRSSAGEANIWFSSGGKTARVFHSPDRGQTWQVFDTPILRGPDSAGIFSIAFRDPLHGVIAGGDYKHPDDDGPDLAFTEDGGKTWTLSQIKPQAFFSAVAYDQKVEQAALQQESNEKASAEAGRKIRIKPSPPQRLFLIHPDFVFEFRPPNNPRRMNGNKKKGLAFNAVSSYPEGGALIVGPKGSIVFFP
jgi:photosystem II stability/assembly factor-like uncharacterized protein